MTRLLPGPRQRDPGQARPDDAREIELSLRDPDRFGVIFDRYFTEIHRYLARRIGPDAADDLAAETFLTAFRVRHRFDAGRGTVRAWLFGIATNQLSRHRRAELRGLRAMARAAQPAAADSHADRVAERVTAGAAGCQLAGALAGLPGRDREVLLLVALGGLSHAEVATALGIPYGTVGSRLSRARGKLRPALDGCGPDGTAPDDSVPDDSVPDDSVPDRAEGHGHDR
jgi:RNA polymerase sigma factor (sigma-70 family)